jgi:hypothetical protein
MWFEEYVTNVRACNATWYDVICVRLGTTHSSANDSRYMYLLCVETEYIVSPICIVKDKVFLDDGYSVSTVMTLYETISESEYRMLYGSFLMIIKHN